MSASIANAIQPSNTNPSDNAGYSWFVANSTELYGIFASDDLLRSLENLELQLNLREGTAKRFKALYDHASNVSEHEEVLYATTWDAYHEALDSDHNLTAIANAYAQSHPIPLHRRMDEWMQQALSSSKNKAFRFLTLILKTYLSITVNRGQKPCASRNSIGTSKPITVRKSQWPASYVRPIPRPLPTFSSKTSPEH